MNPAENNGKDFNMTGATHMILPAALVSLGLFNKPASLALAFGSHFLLDAIPHYELRRKWNYAFSALTGIYLCCRGWQEQDGFLLLAVFFGILPDVLNKLYVSPAFSKVHSFFHFKKKSRIPSHYLMAELFAYLILFLSTL